MATPIRELKAKQRCDFIRVRVCRMWGNHNMKTGTLISLDFLLVDENVSTNFNKYDQVL